MGAEAVTTCRQCGKRQVEPEREDWATPVCWVCLPPPAPPMVKGRRRKLPREMVCRDCTHAVRCRFLLCDDYKDDGPCWWLPSRWTST